MGQDELFERLWSGAASMEEWTQAVSAGVGTVVTDNILTVHSTYFCGSVTAIRTKAGLVLIDTANAALASQTLAAVRRWDDRPVYTVIDDAAAHAATCARNSNPRPWASRIRRRRPR